jgi:hypothetical protein
MNTLELTEDNVISFHMKRLERKRWDAALADLKGASKKRSWLSRDDMLSQNCHLARDINACLHPASLHRSDELDAPPSSSPSETTLWLQRWHLESLDDALRALGLTQPANSLDLLPEDVANLHLKRLEKVRWDKAMEDLRESANLKVRGDKKNLSHL